MALLRFYGGKTLAPVANLDADVINLSATVGLNGSASGYVTVEETSSNHALLTSLKENSHFIKFGVDQVYGGVIESVSKEKNIWTINFIGAYEYFGKVDAVASHKAATASIRASSDDYSNIKIFYSDSSVGILYEILRNNAASMTARGFDSSLINYTNLRDFITSSSSVEWGRSYRLNSLETPTLKTIIDDLFEDSGMQLLRIRTSSDLTSNFSFIFEVVSSATAYEIDEEVDDVYSIVEEIAEPERRSYSIAKGTDLSDLSAVERVSFDSDVAYSSSIVTAPQERSGAIKRYAQGSADAASVNDGVLSFSSFSDDYNPLDYVEISSDKMEEVSGIIFEKSIEGITFTYKIQIGDAVSFNGALKKPTNELRKIIFNPLNSTANLSSKTAQRKQNSTGWRS